MSGQRVAGEVRVALIGAGGISHTHATGFLKHKNRIRCVALVDVSEQNLKARADQLGDSSIRTFGDWKVMLKEMRDQIDAVDICLPHHLHGPAILDACAAGKHVICEKPMCTSLAEADRILDAVNRSGITYMSAHNQLFMPVVQEAKRMIDAGELGRIYWIRSQDCFIAQTERHKWGWRADRKTQGGGELIDTGYHPTYRLLHLAGAKPAQVHGTLGRFALDIDGEDTASVHIRFENGIIGEILTSWAMNNPFGTHHIHVIAENGQLFGSDNTLHHLPRGATEPTTQIFEPVETFEAQIAHFADCLLNDRKPIHGAQEGKTVLEVILRACESDQGWEKCAVART